MQERDSQIAAAIATEPDKAPLSEPPRHGRALLTHTALQRHEWLRKLVSATDKTKTIGPAMSPSYQRTVQDQVVSFTFSVGGIPPDVKPQSVAELLRQVYETLPWPEFPVVKVVPPGQESVQEQLPKARVYRAEFWW